MRTIKELMYNLDKSTLNDDKTLNKDAILDINNGVIALLNGDTYTSDFHHNGMPDNVWGEIKKAFDESDFLSTCKLLFSYPQLNDDFLDWFENQVKNDYPFIRRVINDAVIGKIHLLSYPLRDSSSHIILAVLVEVSKPNQKPVELIIYNVSIDYFTKVEGKENIATGSELEGFVKEILTQEEEPLVLTVDK